MSTVTITASANSTPFNLSPYNVGDGSGYYISFNSGPTCGSIAPPGTADGFPIWAICTNGTGGHTFFVVVGGTWPLDTFSAVSFTTTGFSDHGVPLSFATADASIHDTTTFPGYTMWGWDTGGHNYPFLGATVITFTGFIVPTLPIGLGDITDPSAWQDTQSPPHVPPGNFTNVPQNVNYPLNGDGRYWWVGNAYTAPAGVNYFIGNPLDLIDTAAINWQMTEFSNDGSTAVVSTSIDGGVTWVDNTLPGIVQGLQSGQILLPLGSATGFGLKVTFTGGTPSSTANKTEVAISVTRNALSVPIWDTPNPFDPVNYNGQVMDTPGYDTLLTLQTRMLIRLGFANQTAAPPPGMAALLQEFLQSSQNYLYRRYSATRTRRWFRWKVNPLQRFYSLLDNDENILQGYTMDPEKTVIYAGIQDSRNVWYPLIEGIPAPLYTMLAKPWRPARYEIRNAIELYPAPDQTYWLWVKGHFGLQSFSAPSDITTIDSELVFLHALANAKSHYGQPDANNIEAQANAFRAELVASSHKTGHYIPGTIAVPPAVRPTLIGYSNNQGG